MKIKRFNQYLNESVSPQEEFEEALARAIEQIGQQDENGLRMQSLYDGLVSYVQEWMKADAAEPFSSGDTDEWN